VAGGGGCVGVGAGGWVVTGCAVVGGWVAAGAAAVGAGRLALGAVEVELVDDGITMLSIPESAPDALNGLITGGGSPIVAGVVVVAVDVVVATSRGSGVAAEFGVSKGEALVRIVAAEVAVVRSSTAASSAAVMFALAAITPAMPTVVTTLVMPTARRARLAGWGLDVI